MRTQFQTDAPEIYGHAQQNLESTPAPTLVVALLALRPFSFSDSDKIFVGFFFLYLLGVRSPKSTPSAFEHLGGTTWSPACTPSSLRRHRNRLGLRRRADAACLQCRRMLASVREK